MSAENPEKKFTSVPQEQARALTPEELKAAEAKFSVEPAASPIEQSEVGAEAASAEGYSEKLKEAYKLWNEGGEHEIYTEWKTRAANLSDHELLQELNAVAAEEIAVEKANSPAKGTPEFEAFRQQNIERRESDVRSRLNERIMELSEDTNLSAPLREQFMGFRRGSVQSVFDFGPNGELEPIDVNSERARPFKDALQFLKDEGLLNENFYKKAQEQHEQGINEGMEVTKRNSKLHALLNVSDERGLTSQATLPNRISRARAFSSEMAKRS